MPHSGFEDDGGTRAWRNNQATWSRTIDIYPNRRTALRAYFRSHPFSYVVLGIWAGLLPALTFIVGFCALLLYWAAKRWLFGSP
jgi:hypothetical protein